MRRYGDGKRLDRIRKLANQAAAKVEKEMRSVERSSPDLELFGNYGRSVKASHRLRFILHELRGLESDCTPRNALPERTEETLTQTEGEERR